MAIDGWDLPAYANGQRFVSKNGPEREKASDPDASWDQRSAVSTRKGGGGFEGYKVHAAVCAIMGLPLAWTVDTARTPSGLRPRLPLIDATNARGSAVKTAIMDKAYDNEPIHTGCIIAGRSGHGTSHDSRCRPWRPQAALVRAREWTFGGRGFKRKATKWRCPTGECQPASVWVKTDRLHPRFPSTTERSRKLYCSRGAVEREFGRLKREWAMLPLRVRGLDRVRLHADLTILARLTIALARARARATCRIPVRWRTDGNATALGLAAADLRSALPPPLPKSASDRIDARARFPQCSGTNAETRPMIVSPAFRQSFRQSLLGLLVLRSRRDRLPFGEAEQQARATDSSDG